MPVSPGTGTALAQSAGAKGRNETSETYLVFGRKSLPSNHETTKPGDVVELNAYADDRVELFSGGRLVARGQAVVVGGKLAVRVQEVPNGLYISNARRGGE